MRTAAIAVALLVAAPAGAATVAESMDYDTCLEIISDHHEQMLINPDLFRVTGSRYNDRAQQAFVEAVDPKDPKHRYRWECKGGKIYQTDAWR